MNLTKTLVQLAQAERAIAQGVEHILHQRQIAEELARDGRHPGVAALAQELLKQLEELQTLHIADRDRLRKEADKFSR